MSINTQWQRHAWLILPVVAALLSVSITFVSHQPTAANVDGNNAWQPDALVATDTVSREPSGNLFTAGRTLQQQGDEPPAEKAPEPDAKPFKLVGVIMRNGQQQAVFVANSKRIVLAQGQHDPALGTLTAIKPNRVITQTEQGQPKHWALFPVNQPSPKSNQEDAPES